MADITVQSMAGGHPEWIEACTVWWHRQWGKNMGYSLDGARMAIDGLTSPEEGKLRSSLSSTAFPVAASFWSTGIWRRTRTSRHGSPVYSYCPSSGEWDLVGD